MSQINGSHRYTLQIKDTWLLGGLWAPGCPWSSSWFWFLGCPWSFSWFWFLGCPWSSSWPCSPCWPWFPSWLRSISRLWRLSLTLPCWIFQTLSFAPTTTILSYKGSFWTSWSNLAVLCARI